MDMGKSVFSEYAMREWAALYGQEPSAETILVLQMMDDYRKVRLVAGASDSAIFAEIESLLDR